MKVLGIDTSNYTTSVCIYDSENHSMLSHKKLLPVKEGELGLRQSDAVFHHVKQLHEVIEKLGVGFGKEISAIAVSNRPSVQEGSYMPVFLAGICVADTLSNALDIPKYEFTHQQGHVAAALYSANKLDLLDKDFFAFHVSGGTTDLLLVEKTDTSVLNCKLLASSNDLKMGQAVDRLGNKFGLPFPSGKYLDEIAEKGSKKLLFPAILKGLDCSISGFENRFNDYISQGESKEDIAYSFFIGLSNVLYKMATKAREKYGDKPIVFSGGVMCNSIIKSNLLLKLDDIYFAAPEFSSDNAAGTAFLGYKKQTGEI